VVELVDPRGVVASGSTITTSRSPEHDPSYLRATISSTGTWTIGPFDPTTTPGFDTPGSPNSGCNYANPCPADLDGNGSVSSSDLSTLLNFWGTNNATADLDRSGDVGSADLSILLNAWGNCP
jgi:hypothetical protein